MRDVDAPVASEVVRRRLEELFTQLQAAPMPEVPQESPARSTSVGAPSGSAEAEAEWLDRLRVPQEVAAVVVAGPPQPDRAQDLRVFAGRAATFTKEHLATVMVVLLVGVGWTAYSLLQVRATPVADAAPQVVNPPSSTSSGPSPGATTGTGKQVVVHVIGAVNTPGVVRLADGSRVADAITAAGGLSAKAAVGELNLAQVLVDGTQLKIGTGKHPGGWIRDGSSGGGGGGGNGGSGNGGSGNGGSGGSSSAKVSLNTATLQQLDTLPGIGPVTAQKILDWRKAHGKFTAITELQEVDGIGPKTYADLAGAVRL
jgi:competence protein ComEA